MVQFTLFENETANQITLEDVFKAYYECRRGKRRTINALAFELNFEQELVQLWREINAGTYKIGRSIAFVVKQPVQREVFAANFKDRIVHHLIIDKINGLLEKEFITDSYSCREGKGMLYGVKRIEQFIKDCSEGYKRDCYILKLDIRSFFMSIDKNILYQNLSAFLKEKYHRADRAIILRLIKQIIFYQPENHCAIKGTRADWNGLPCHKSLFWSKGHCGLPIGNLTSQIFANFYLHGLDKFVREQLNIQYYGRYVDDFVLLHQDKKVLIEARQKISSFLYSNLRITLHPQKFYLQHYSKGVKFIGTVLKPHRIYIGTRTKTNLYDKLYKMLPLMAVSLKSTLSKLDSFVSTVNSYLGFMRHYNTYNLRSRILSKIKQSFLGEIVETSPQAVKLSVDKQFLKVRQKRRQLRCQRQYRRQIRKKSKGEQNGFI